MPKTSDSALSVRAGFVLKSLIETHISDGQPVGSRTLSTMPGLGVSAATIRNIMSDLEREGYITAPHTSAGRIPTEAGYRFFVDSLLQVEPLTRDAVGDLKHQLEGVSGSQEIIHTASSLLSGVTQMAGLVSLPKADASVLQQVELLALSDRRVLAVLVMCNGDVQNRIVALNRKYSRAELEQVGNYLTEHFSGKNLRDARVCLSKELAELQQGMNELMAAVVELGEQALESEVAPDEGLVVEGQNHLMDYAELSDIEKLRQLFDAFNEKGEILHVLERCESANALQIYIGQESGQSALGDCSVITAPYSVDGDVVGVLGVIGPTRMAYERIIPVVDVTAKLLGSALNSR